MSSNTQLLASKIRDISHNDQTTKELIEFVDSACEKRSLDKEKVVNELIKAIDNTTDIRNISAFVRAVVGKMNYDDFKKEIKKPIFTALDRALVQNGITGETWELFLIHSIETHCLNEFNINAESLIATNRAIVEYCKNNNIKTLKGFKELLLRSKVLSNCNIPIVVLEKQAKRHGAKWDEIMKDLEEDESLYGEIEKH